MANSSKSQKAVNTDNTANDLKDEFGRVIVKRNVVLSIDKIERSNRFADDYFIITNDKGTKVHQGLEVNDVDSAYGNGGSWLVGEDFLMSQLVHKFNLGTIALGTILVANCPIGDQCNLVLDVEERVVGQEVFDKDGNSIIYEGPRDKYGNPRLVEGDTYYQAINYRIEPSDTLYAEAERLAREVAMQKLMRGGDTGSNMQRRRRSSMFGNVATLPADNSSDTTEKPTVEQHA